MTVFRKHYNVFLFFYLWGACRCHVTRPAVSDTRAGTEFISSDDMNINIKQIPHQSDSCGTPSWLLKVALITGQWGKLWQESRNKIHRSLQLFLFPLKMTDDNICLFFSATTIKVCFQSMAVLQLDPLGQDQDGVHPVISELEMFCLNFHFTCCWHVGGGCWAAGPKSWDGTKEPRVRFNIRRLKTQRHKESKNQELYESMKTPGTKHQETQEETGSGGTQDKHTHTHTHTHTWSQIRHRWHQTVGRNRKRHMRVKLQNKTGNDRRTARIMTGASSPCFYSCPERTKQTPSQQFWFLFSSDWSQGFSVSDHVV